MQTIRVKKHLDSETLVLPEIRSLIGKDVEITVVEYDTSEATKPLNGNFAETFGKYPDFDEAAFWALRGGH